MKSDHLSIDVHTWIEATQTEGPGWRFALWVQGCSIGCRGCCNPEMLSFGKGRRHRVEEIHHIILNAQQQKMIEGVTFLGGEPFDQAYPLAFLAEKIQQSGLSLMIFSGYTLEHLRRRRDFATQALLHATDILVDGAYIKEEYTDKRRWIGSKNQTVHFLTQRYSADDPCWLQPNSIEFILQNGELKIVGFPRWQALFRGWQKKKTPNFIKKIEEKNSSKRISKRTISFRRKQKRRSGCREPNKSPDNGEY